MLEIIKPGQIVKHYSNPLHYALQMEVKAAQNDLVRVAFINIYGAHEELWIDKHELDIFEESDYPCEMSNS